MKLKISIIILGFLILLTTSEFIYQVNNNPAIQFWYEVKLSRFFIKTSQPKIAFRYIGKVTDYKLQNPNLSVQKALEIPNLSGNPNLNKEYKLLLRNLGDDILFQTDLNEWAKIFYTLGLLAYKNNEPELVESFWQSAINFAPQWSYFHIELANFYLRQGNEEQAKKVLEFCFNFKYPNKHCRQYRDNNLLWKTPEEVGFLKEEVESFSN